MANIFREVDEDIRKERYINLFRKYGVYVIAIIVIIVGTLAGIQFYSGYQVNKNEMLFAEYINIIENNSDDTLEKLLDSGETSNIFLNGMYLLKRSDLLVASGQIDQATLLLSEAIENNNLNKIHNDVAIYKLLMINIETLSIEEIKSYQNKLISEVDAFYLIEELIAIKFLIEGQKEDAIKKFSELSANNSVPIEIKNRSAVFIKIANQ
ncbi:hypothetical protein OAJ23_03090 [Pelagibacteraceae bacterium]|jgi:hypothetical protein|nr:hypothetical protein [Pelagibacteraceae bacterium]